MRTDRAVVAATVVVLVGAAVAAGPLFGLSLTSSGPADPGTGSMDATVEEIPQRGSLSAKNYGDGGYTLRGAPALVSVDAVSGRPYLSYTLAVPELKYSTTSLTPVGASGRHRLSMEPSTLSAEKVDRERYNGTVSIHVIDDDGRRLLAETEVTVEVRE